MLSPAIHLANDYEVVGGGKDQEGFLSNIAQVASTHPKGGSLKKRFTKK